MAPDDKYLLVLDIDDTQIVDRNYLKKNGGYIAEEEQKNMAILKEQLESLAASGKAVIVFATNGIIQHYKDVAHLLARPHYISSNASTRLYECDTATGDVSLDKDHAAHIRSGNFSSAIALALGRAYEELQELTPEHQSDIKASFEFKPGTPAIRMEEVYQELQKLVRDSGLDAKVHLVEGKNDFYIDFLPIACEKGFNIEWIAKRAGISFDHVIVFGNGTNDISMFRSHFNGVAVGNSVAALKRHVAGLSSEQTVHIVADGERAGSVINGLKKFNLA